MPRSRKKASEDDKPTPEDLAFIDAIKPYKMFFDPDETEVADLAQQLLNRYSFDHVGFLHMRAHATYVSMKDRSNIEGFIAHLLYGIPWERDPDEVRPTRTEAITLYAFMAEKYAGQ